MFNNVRFCSSALLSLNRDPPSRWSRINVSGTLAENPISESCLQEPECAKCAPFPTFFWQANPLLTSTLLFTCVNPFQTSCRRTVILKTSLLARVGLIDTKAPGGFTKIYRLFLALLEILIYWVCGRVWEYDYLQGSQVTLITRFGNHSYESFIWLRIYAVALR